jgi:hypothetical protein
MIDCSLIRIISPHRLTNSQIPCAQQQSVKRCKLRPLWRPKRRRYCGAKRLEYDCQAPQENKRSIYL